MANHRRYPDMELLNMEELDAEAEDFLGKALPALTGAAFGGAMGYCTGRAVKKAGQKAAVFVGAAFITIQLLAYNGLIQVPWDKWQKLATKVLDADGDGELTPEDTKIWFRKFSDAMTFALPSSAGFMAGFLSAFQMKQ